MLINGGNAVPSAATFAEFLFVLQMQRAEAVQIGGVVKCDE